MLQPKKDNFRLNQADQAILEKEMIAYAEEGASDDDLIEFKNTYVAEKKKATPKSELASTPQKSVSGTPTGSSVGVNPAFKSSIPSPIPDFNSMESVKSVVQKPKIKLQKPPVKEDTSFFDYLKENLDTGLATVSKSIYDTPGLVYDAAASITNPIFRAMGVGEDKLASSDKLANDLGFKNIPSEILKEKIKVSNEKINAYSAKNGGDALQAVQDGNYVGAAKLVAGTTAQSLPIMIAAMASGGESMALTSIGVSTASTKNAQLKEENPEMALGTRVLNSANAGIIEAVTGHLFTGASGAVMKKIIADKGVEAGSKIIGKSFRTTIEKSIEKNPLVSAVGEVVEESAVEFGNQVNDMSSGIRTEFDFHAIKNAGLSATGMGGLQTLGVYGAKGYVKAKDYAKLKSINKEVFKLRSEIDKGNLSPENKAILGLRADRLEAENKKLLGTEIEKAKALPTEAKTELNALNAEFEGLKTKFDDIDDADDIPDNLKPALKEEIRIQATKNQKRKTEILSQNDGLEVKDDFSKFEGVEPDFDLENGKISSLPLKEQDRLNKLAVEQITGGDKTIEYSKEQVSQTANEIYKNEQTPPTTEAQPQAEVPQQAEAKKVAEVSPVEDVVATSVEKKTIKQLEAENKTTLPKIPSNKIFKNEVTPLTQNQTKGVDKIIEQNKENDLPTQKIDIGLIVPTQKTVNTNNLKKTSEITEETKISEPIVLVKENGKYYVVDGHHRISNEILNGNTIVEAKVFDNEATPETNTPTNGNVQLGASNVGESGITEQESPVQESVSSSVDGGEVKGDASVGEKSVPLPNLDDIADFINQTYLNDEQAKQATKTDQGAEKNSTDKNSEKSPREEKAKKISLKGRTPLKKRKFKGDRAKASNVEVIDEASLVLNYFVNGGKISSDYIESSLSKGDLKAKNNNFNGIASVNAKGIDALAHDLWDDNHNFDIAKIKEEIESVTISHNTVQDITETILKNSDVVLEKTPEEYADEYYNNLEVQEELNASDEEMQEAQGYLDQLSDAEIIELANSQEKSYDDYIKDLEKRQVTYDLGSFSEQGTIQPDGWILSENGELLSPQSVRNVKQVNPSPEAKVEAKKQISKDTPELKEVNAKLEKANEKLRIAKDALDRKAKSLDKELLKDNEDIFGQRKNQNENKLFDERVDGNARNKATEKERNAIIDAQNEIKSLKEAKAKIENGEIVSTSKMDFESPIEVKKEKVVTKEIKNETETTTENEPTNNKKQAQGNQQNQVKRESADRGDNRGVQEYKGKSVKEQQNKRPGIVVQAESLMPVTKDFTSKNYEIDEVQKQGVNSALTLFQNGGKAFLLADGTGVGKTRQILVTAKEFVNKIGGKVLIISENTTILTKNFAKDAEALGIDMSEFEFGTYNDLRTGKAGKGNYGLVIYDEAHNLKNQESGKAIASNNVKTNHNLYVTATPMDTIGSAVYFITEVSGVSEIEAYSQLGLNVKVQKDPETGQQIKIVTLKEGVAPVDIKRNIVKIREQIIANGAMLRREYPFYGEFVEDKISMTESQSEEHNDIESSWDDRIEYESVNDNGTVNIRKKMNLSGQKSGELSRWSESTKIKYTLAEVEKEIKAGNKVVVIAEGVNETTITAIDKVVPGFLSEMSKLLKAKGYKVAEIYGKSDKGKANDQFQSNEVDVVLGTAKSASTGIDLDDQNGDNPRVLFMVTPNYSGNVFQQILGRVSRRNTKSPATVRLLYNDSNIDARRKQIVNGKLQTLKAIQEGVIDDDIEIDTQIATQNQEPINVSNFSLEDISEKAFVIKGDTKPIKDDIKSIGGRYNPKYGGWIFPKTKKAEVQELLNKLGQENKPTSKEIAFAEVDKIAQKIKDILPGINDPDLKKQGFSQDQLIDLIATAVKKLISAGIDVNEAIKQVVDSIKTKFGEIDIDIDAVRERVSPKKEADNSFKSKSGKKSLLGRLIEGGNPDLITKAVKELGDNYDIRNQQEANDEAMAFIDKVGASEALKAIKDGLITNSDVKMLIYDEALTRLKTEISDEMDNNPEDREALIQKFQEVSDDFDRAIRDAGQGIAIMNYIYNKNQTLKYNLKKQIADWKRNDPNNEIPADIKAKYEELDQKLKDLEEKTKDAEVRAKKAEDELAIKNIQEDVERKNQAARKNKSGLTPQEQNRKKQLRDKFARANDVTGIPALLVDPEFREYLGLVLKTAKGDFSNFSNEILKELGKSARQHLPELFKEAGGKGDVKVTDLQSITVNEEGKIKIPAQLLRDYVEQGYTDIDEIAALIKDDIADEFPDADIRDIRDALTGYGKQINPNKDEITAQVNKLKEYGRLLSAYDDVMNGEMPKKSGLVRPKSEQKARELRRNINRLAKELNLEPVDLESQWSNAVDKVKSHLKNQIEDLDKQIANGEKRKIDRTPIKLDEEATALKAIRDAKKQILDDLVGKPELTEEQKIANAEKSLDNSIKKLQEEIDTNDIAFKEKPTAVTSKKIEQLKANKKALLETKKQLRQEAGLIEQQRLKTTKTRIKNQIEDLNTRIKNKDFAKKEVKPILADSELNTLRAEKEAVYEEYEKMKYLQELKNRTFAKKLMDEGLEALGLARAIKASLDLGLIGIQLRGFTYSELWRNPKELAHKFIKMFGAIGSQNKTNKAMSELIGHPLHALAKKLDIGMTHPDLRNEVREEMASGNLLHFIWSSPVLAVEALGGKEAMNSKRASIGDSFIDSVKKQYNKLFQNYQVDIKQKEKFSVKEQWKNINAFEAVERGLSIYGNQLRFEEFVRGVDRLKAEGKDEINHLEDYKELASYIRTFSGRAKPMGFKLNQKALNVFFFSFKNMASVIQQLNPYYMLIELNKSNLKRGVYKPTVANKMAMATMFKSVVSTSATLLFVMAAYNAFKDDDEEEATIEKDPRSSDFGKLKIGNFRYDPWGGYIPLISLYARLATEEVKKSDGTISKFGEDRFGIQNRGDAASRFLINKESPGFQMFHKYMTSTEEVDKATGETYRATPFGGKLSEEDAYSFYPIFLGSVKSAKEKDYEGVQAFLTAYSILGLGNVQEYETKEKKPKSSKKGVPGVPNFGRMKINP